MFTAQQVYLFIYQQSMFYLKKKNTAVMVRVIKTVLMSCGLIIFPIYMDLFLYLFKILYRFPSNTFCPPLSHQTFFTTSIISFKGKGKMVTYWLNGRDDMDEFNDSMVCKFVPKKKRTGTLLTDSSSTLMSKSQSSTTDVNLMEDLIV